MPITPECQPPRPGPAPAGTPPTPADHRLGLLQDLAFQGLALRVQIVQIPGLNPGLGQVVAEQQLQSAPGLAHRAGGIEPGRQAKDHVPQEMVLPSNWVTSFRAMMPGRSSSKTLRPWLTRMRSSPSSGTTSAAMPGPRGPET